MKFKLDTNEIHNMVSTVAKGAGNGKFMAITAYSELRLESGVLCATCLDGANFITYSIDGVKGEDGNCIVDIDRLSKLVGKTTVDEMKFELKEDYLSVKGNGSYKIPVVTGEKFPTFNMDDATMSVTKNCEDIKRMFKANRYSISKDKNSAPALLGYLVQDKCITGNGQKICVTNIDIFDEEPVLVSPDLASMVELLQGEEVEISYCEGKLQFKSDNITVRGAELEGKDEYPEVGAILNSLDFPFGVELDKYALKSILERVGIFANGKDNIAVKFNFKTDRVVISDQNDESEEELMYESVANIEDGVQTALDIRYFQEVLAPLEEETIHLYFGNGVAIKLEENEITELLAVMTLE